MAWTFSGVLLDGFAGDRVVAGTGEPEELPGRYALAGLVDAHAHPTVAADGRGLYLADGEHGTGRLAEYAASGVTVIRDTGGLSPVSLGFARTAAAGPSGNVCPRPEDSDFQKALAAHEGCAPAVAPVVTVCASSPARAPPAARGSRHRG